MIKCESLKLDCPIEQIRMKTECFEQNQHVKIRYKTAERGMARKKISLKKIFLLTNQSH